MPNKFVNIELTDKEFEELKKLKEELGLTWKGALKRGMIEKTVGSSTGSKIRGRRG